MRTLPDTELQARLLRETIEVEEKKRKLEAALSALDVRMQLLIGRAVRKDIEAYKNRSCGCRGCQLRNDDCE
jgi:hypothetical protein